MDFPITLERKVEKATDDWMIFALEGSVKHEAFERINRNPTLTELLYNQTEDEMLTLVELLDQENE